MSYGLLIFLGICCLVISINHNAKKARESKKDDDRSLF